MNDHDRIPHDFRNTTQFIHSGAWKRFAKWKPRDINQLGIWEWFHDLASYDLWWFDHETLSCNSNGYILWGNFLWITIKSHSITIQRSPKYTCSSIISVWPDNIARLLRYTSIAGSCSNVRHEMLLKCRDLHIISYHFNDINRCMSDIKILWWLGGS